MLIYRNYQKLIHELKELSYQFVTYTSLIPNKPHIILRHDIDVCCEKAFKFAQFEHELGLSSHYFILVSSELYNPNSLRNRNIIKKIINLGHQIGLHFDPSIYSNDLIEDAARKECHILEGITEKPVSLISFHRPGSNPFSRNEIFADRINTYGNKYFNEIGYCSDSKGEWRFGSPLEHTSIQKQTALQLVTHPIWWQEADINITPIETLESFALQHFDYLTLTLGEQCEPFKNYHSNHKIRSIVR